MLDYATPYHAPVLCHSVADRLITDPDGVYVDATLGGGGHTHALFDALGDEARVIGLDRDPEALETATARLESAGYGDRFMPVRGTFSDMEEVIRAEGLQSVSGILMDLGVSSHQLDDGQRGFSHRLSGPLDMRMDQTSGEPASAFLDKMDEAELARVLRVWGEEPMAGRMARAILRGRPLRSTTDLADVIREEVPPHKVSKSLARVFQALRIAVNGEMDELRRALEAATSLVAPGGRLAVISYHSLEDRPVKRYLRSGHFDGEIRRDLYGNALSPWRDVTRGAIMADETETATNPRARSARLRVAERTTCT
ncbi:MAG: 16S rRNA (cytosine(1402)-N(4))-methyltransferase [Bacteroidetes bacterium CG12_big_fil_rev_8_21_14_0_65_60_17]|nr:MAG: 16S rRNA (cytosine(1402)-N(4))-methyltransferase [Bacteroidetes bacterium CG12_big_fil_rev_8_21_14_0_65_60_17]